MRLTWLEIRRVNWIWHGPDPTVVSAQTLPPEREQMAAIIGPRGPQGPPVDISNIVFDGGFF